MALYQGARGLYPPYAPMATTEAVAQPMPSCSRSVGSRGLFEIHTIRHILQSGKVTYKQRNVLSGSLLACACTWSPSTEPWKSTLHGVLCMCTHKQVWFLNILYLYVQTNDTNPAKPGNHTPSGCFIPSCSWVDVSELLRLRSQEHSGSSLGVLWTWDCRLLRAAASARSLPAPRQTNARAAFWAADSQEFHDAVSTAFATFKYNLHK
jgi:hypothetical protein